LAEKNLYTEREITPLRQARAQAQQAAMDQAKKQSDSEVAKNVAPVITAIRGKNGNAQG
jgi:predicted negative regulator of RcsB-dependent stress response